MRVYRLTQSKYAEDLNGTGAKLYGGRWNHIDSPCIYTAESRALSILEYAVNINIDFIPRGLSMCIFEIDDEQIHILDIEDLPENWYYSPAPKSTKDLGTELLKQHAVIRVPSTIIHDEFNYIINPLAKNINFKLLEAKDYIFDLRIKYK